jgi:hypothetical protein
MIRNTCSACGKSLIYQVTGESCCGVQIEINVYGNVRDSMRRRIQHNLGPYKMGTYSICYECWLRSLGVKPDEDDYGS